MAESSKNDLLVRLRVPRPRPGYPDPLPPHPWMVEATDEIERLQRAIGKWSAHCVCRCEACHELSSGILDPPDEDKR